MNTHAHFHTHVNTHFCGCGRTHVSAHTHVHEYEVAPEPAPVVAPRPVAPKPVAPRASSPIAQRTRSKIHRAIWENTPWTVADKDLADFLDFLHQSEDPWERSLIAAVEYEAIRRQVKCSEKC